MARTTTVNTSTTTKTPRTPRKCPATHVLVLRVFRDNTLTSTSERRPKPGQKY